MSSNYTYYEIQIQQEFSQFTNRHSFRQWDKSDTSPQTLPGKLLSSLFKSDITFAYLKKKHED